MRLQYDPRALADLREIHEFIARDDATAAGRVIARIRHSIERLSVLPFSGRPGVKDTRLLVVPNLPYIVVHRVCDNFVEILAVFHTARERRE